MYSHEIQRLLGHKNIAIGDRVIVQKEAFMGFEFDAGVRARLYRDHALLGLEAGVLKTGPALERPHDAQDREIYPELPWTIQFWAAYVI